MPIYEFYCPDCHTIFSFLSKVINTDKKPTCPRCQRKGLERQVSRFAVARREKVGTEDLSSNQTPPVDEAKMEQALASLASEAGSLNEEDPRQAAGLMRKLSDMTGVRFGEGMEEAIRRMERGEDPERIEEDLGDVLEGEEDPFSFPNAEQGGRSTRRWTAPLRDEKLYEL